MDVGQVHLIFSRLMVNIYFLYTVYFQDTNKSDMVTPRIDKAVEMYRQRQQQRSNTQPSSTDTSVIQSVTDTEQSPGSSRHRSFVKVNQLISKSGFFF